MKNKIILTMLFVSILSLQGCAAQIIGTVASTTIAVAAIPVKMGVAVAGAAASAATNTVIDRMTEK